MTKLSTHVLDVYAGKPGSGISVDLFYINNSERKKITSVKLNNDGRTDSPLVEGENFIKGKYELVFYILILVKEEGHGANNESSYNWSRATG